MMDKSLRLGAVAFLATAAAAQERFFTPEGPAPASRFGSLVSPAGDVDADGFPDFAVGAPDAGLVQVYSGFDGTQLATLRGAASGERFGAALAPAGDADADGHADLAVGAPEAGSGTLQDAGRVVLLSGRTGAELARRSGATGHDRLGSALAVLQVPDGETLQLALGVPGADTAGNGAGLVLLLDAATLKVRSELQGRAPLDAFGTTLAAPGDTDKDGVQDLAVGAPFADPAGEASGRVWVISGATGADLFTASGAAVGEKAGLGLSAAGDVDGDGYADLAVGAPFAKKGGTARYGRVDVFSGRSGQAIRTWLGDSIDDRFGWSVAAAGDVDGDGAGDVSVGAPWADAGGRRSGTVVVLSGLDGAALTALHGDAAGMELGTSVSAAGDLDGDGCSEVLAGAPAALSERGLALVASPRAGAAGSATSLGLPCGAGEPALAAHGVIELGRRVPLTVTGARPGAAVCVAASSRAPRAPLELGAGCAMIVDPREALVLGSVAAGADGRALLFVELPSAPVLAGAGIWVQSLVHPTAGALGFDLTNGLELRLGH